VSGEKEGEKGDHPVHFGGTDVEFGGVQRRVRDDEDVLEEGNREVGDFAKDGGVAEGDRDVRDCLGGKFVFEAVEAQLVFGMEKVAGKVSGHFEGKFDGLAVHHVYLVDEFKWGRVKFALVEEVW
jgi:hypothetical protein